MSGISLLLEVLGNMYLHDYNNSILCPLDLPVIAELAALSSLFISSSVTLVIVAVAWIRYRLIYAMAVLLGELVPFLIPKLFTPKQRND